MRLGQWQLQRLQVFYCQHGGSSGGARALVTSGGVATQSFESWKASNPQIAVEVHVNNGNHPRVVGYYAFDRKLPDGTRVPRQICVKNKSPRAILDVMQSMRDKSGRKAPSWNERQWKVQDSIQGVWTPLVRID